MNWDNFDDQFREKLENIPMGYDDSAWAKFNNETSKIKPLQTKTFSNIFKIAASLVLISSLVVAGTQLKQNFDLKKQYNVLENENKKLEKHQQLIEKKLKELQKEIWQTNQKIFLPF